MDHKHIILGHMVPHEDVHPEMLTLRAAPLVSSANNWRDIGVVDQGPWGSCTAFAMRYAYRLRYDTRPEPSTAYWYARSRGLLYSGSLMDTGSTVKATVTVLKTLGTQTETLWPYISNNIFLKPPVFADLPMETGIEAIPRQSTWQAQCTLMKSILASGKNILLGISVYSNFMTTTVLRTGIIPMPKGSILGGHAICLIGFDTTGPNPGFLFYNSWGAYSGNRGLFILPFEHGANSKYAGDWWSF